MPDEFKIRIYVVDDDESVRNALKMLFISAGMEVETFEAAEDLLNFQLRENKSCVISDIKMRGLSGLELKQKLTERGSSRPAGESPARLKLSPAGRK